MFLRVFTFLIIVIFCTSCDNFSYPKNKNLQVADTIVDFTLVDFSPSFKVCDSLIDKHQKSNCFRTTIHQKIGAELQKHQFIIRDSISEIVYVDLLINSKGKIVIEAMASSEEIRIQLPELDSVLRISVDKIPNVYAAIKRGIPVTTKYRLPIKIQLKQ
jgi:hypothetical protein